MTIERPNNRTAFAIAVEEEERARVHLIQIREALTNVRMVLEGAPEDSEYTKEMCDAEGSLADAETMLKAEIRERAEALEGWDEFDMKTWVAS